MDRRTILIAGSVRAALDKRGIRSFDDLKRGQQRRVAAELDIGLSELRAGMRQLRGANVVVSHDGTQRLQTRSDPEWLVEMLNDPNGTVWPHVLVIESRLGLKPKGSLCERYDRVSAFLAELRKKSVAGKLSDSEDEAIDRYRRRLRDAEDRYLDRQRESADALSSLQRQAAAVLAASRLAA